MNPKISYILGIYNADRTIEECINSILNQDYPKKSYEIIVIDGGSKDSTLKIVKKLMKKNKNIRLLHNPKKLSEGRGMSKDIGVESAKGDFLIFLDHDNILIGNKWLSQILTPFNDKEIMASQSLLKPRKTDTNFLKYINSIGVEDPFAVPYSLVAQVVLNKKKFKIIDKKYFLYETNTNKQVLFFGANGCSFRKEVFKKIGGYTRDVDVSHDMAKLRMKVAVPLKPRIYHSTANSFMSFLKKKGLYFFRFINKEYKTKSYEWAKVGTPPSKIKFFLMILTNLSILIPLVKIFPKAISTRNFSWLLHPLYLFFVTMEYLFITFFKIGNFLKYL